MALKRRMIAASLGAIAVATTAFAAGHLTDAQQGAIKARQSHMSLYGFNMGTLGGMAQDQIPYDAAAASAAASNLAALAAMDESAYWLEGTDASVEGNRAKAEIWTDPAGFEAAQTRMAESSAALALVAGDGLDALRGAIGPVGQSCGGCHEAYRAPRS